MPRQARLDAPGILQHVMARGIERRKIFLDDKDRVAFLKRLGTILEETQTQCYAWALIPNHFHLLLRTGITPLATVMRRLMTGYAASFNRRHRRSGHLFQNRYKSVVCEEESYLFELVRYIHLNPLRAKLVEDLNALDTYAWTGHSTLLGHAHNPLIDEIFSATTDDGLLSEKTVEDILRYFGKSEKEARSKYREFVEKGIKQGRREELQGGGLIRSSGGDKSKLSRTKNENREKFDQRILGSGEFVSEVLQQAGENLEKKYRPKLSITEIIEMVVKKTGICAEIICSRSRKREISRARSVVAYMAVAENGHSAADVARVLGIKASSVFHLLKVANGIIGEESSEN